MSEQPGYSMESKTPIHKLDDDSLLQIFSCYRLEDEHNWYVRLAWRKLVQVCQRWRSLIYNAWFHLDVYLLLTNDSPSIDRLNHLPPVPLVIDYSDITRTISGKDGDNIYLGLHQHGRVQGVILRAPSSSLRMWLEPMNKLFPRLGYLSLASTNTEEMSPVLPELLRAPDLRQVSLHGIGLPKGWPLLSSTTALSALSLTHIRESCYFSPRHLVTHLQALPHLEELSIGFGIPIPLPSSEGRLLPAPIPPVTLPTLRRLTFRGVGVYLDNLVAQINTPVLERLNLTLLFELAFTLANLTEFICRTEGFGCLAARILFNKDGASIEAGFNEQRTIGKLSLHVNCEPLDWQIDSSAQVCSALRGALSVVEELTVDLDVGGMASDWEKSLDSTLWYELLLPFIGVKKLHVSPSLILELSQSLGSVAGGLVLELLPELEKLEVQLEMGHSKNVFFLFVETRESIGRPVHLSVPPSQQPNKRPAMSEDRFESAFLQFTRSKGIIRPGERDLVINGQAINIWALHREVCARNGFESVSAHNEWPVIGAALGFPQAAGEDAGRPPRCRSVVAHGLLLLYNNVLRQFDHVYLSTLVAPTQEDLFAAKRLVNEKKSIAFSCAADFDEIVVYSPIPESDIQVFRRNVEHLDQVLSNIEKYIHYAFAVLKKEDIVERMFTMMASAKIQLEELKKPNPQCMLGFYSIKGMIQDAYDMDKGLKAVIQRKLAHIIPPSGTPLAPQPPSAIANALFVPPVPPAVPPAPAVTSGSFPTQSPGAIQIWRPTQEDLITAKRWVNEKKVFSCAPDFDGVVSYPPILERDIREYHRDVEHLDQVLANIEKYIHFAFAALKNEEVVERMFNMMASVKFQLEELKKPNPQYVLELHTIRGMIQEADNMDKGFKAVIQRMQVHLTLPGVPSASAPQSPSAVTNALFAPPVPLTVPSAHSAVSRPPHVPLLQPAHEKEPSQAQATQTPPPIPTASTPTPRAATPGITAPSPLTLKFPKRKAATKPKQPTHRKSSTTADGDIEIPTLAHTVASTPTSSTPNHANGGGKRVRDDDIDAPTPGFFSAPSPKRVKSN